MRLSNCSHSNADPGARILMLKACGGGAIIWIIGVLPPLELIAMRILTSIILALVVANGKLLAQTCVLPPSVMSHPASHEACTDSAVIFTAGATGNPPPVVRWQVSTNGGASFANVLGATTTQLVITANSPIPVTGPVFLILMENQNWSSIRGNTVSAPYINNVLLPMAARAERYYNPPGLHPSLPNYIWLETGSSLGITNDSSPAVNHRGTPNHLATLLKNAGVPWRAYQENITGTSCPLTNFSLYAVRHDPFVYFDDVTCNTNPSCAYCISQIRPYTELAADLASNRVARYNFITPNTCNDMHDSCSPVNNRIKQGDTWLSNNLPAILGSQSYSNNGAIFITWDEGASGSDGPIGMIVLSPIIKAPGFTNIVYYTHSSTLRTLQEILGVRPLLGDAANATDLSDLFRQPDPTMNGFQYRAIFSNSCGSVTSSVATLTINTPPSILAPPASQTTCASGSANFSATAVGAEPLTYQWRKLGWGSGWEMRTSGTGSGGFFVGSSINNDGADIGNDGDINTAGKTWGIYANGGFLACAVRRLGAPMNIGETFKIDFDNGYVNTAADNDASIGAGSVGFGLRDAGETNRFEFSFTGGDNQYRINDGSSFSRATGIVFTGQGLHLELTLTGVDTYSLAVTVIGVDGPAGLPQNFTGALTGAAGTGIDRARLFNYSASNGSQGDAFFNSLSVRGQFDNAADPAYNSGWSNGQDGGFINVSGGTNSILTINPATLADAGNYNVLVTGACGSSVSSVAGLTVTPICLSITSPADQAYTTNSTVVVTGTASSDMGISGVTINSTPASSSNGFASWTANVSGLTVGTNILIAVATDNTPSVVTNTSRVIYAAGTFDGNGDGLPDAWQIRYFGDPNSANAAPNMDVNGDGFINLQEYLAGTDPTNAASAFRIIDARSIGGGFRVEWSSVPGKTYAVDYHDDLSSAWTQLTSLTARTMLTNITDNSVSGQTKRFYRIRVLP
jgi:hypothetical protein